MFLGLAEGRDFTLQRSGLACQTSLQMAPRSLQGVNKLPQVSTTSAASALVQKQKRQRLDFIFVRQDSLILFLHFKFVVI